MLKFVGNEEVGRRQAEAEMAGSYMVHGRVERVHPKHEGLRRRLFWIVRGKPARDDGG